MQQLSKSESWMTDIKNFLLAISIFVIQCIKKTTNRSDKGVFLDLNLLFS